MHVLITSFVQWSSLIFNPSILKPEMKNICCLTNIDQISSSSSCAKTLQEKSRYQSHEPFCSWFNVFCTETLTFCNATQYIALLTEIINIFILVPIETCFLASFCSKNPKIKFCHMRLNIWKYFLLRSSHKLWHLPCKLNLSHFIIQCALIL